MKKIMLWLIVFAALSGSALCAQDIAGDWQGTLHTDKGLRIVLKISKTDQGGWNAMFYSIDQGPDSIPVTSITLQGSTVKFSVDPIQGNYQGKISPNGAFIAGTWSQGPPLPLDFQRTPPVRHPRAGPLNNSRSRVRSTGGAESASRDAVNMIVRS